MLEEILQLLRNQANVLSSPENFVPFSYIEKMIEVSRPSTPAKNILLHIFDELEHIVLDISYGFISQFNGELFDRLLNILELITNALGDVNTNKRFRSLEMRIKKIRSNKTIYMKNPLPPRTND